MPINTKTIAVLMGGPGSERDVSLASGRSVCDALAECGANVMDIDVTDEEVELPGEVDLAFNVIHGTFGEDGKLQRLLNSRRIPYTGAGATSSELAFDKGLSKKRFVEHGVPTPAFEFMVAKPGEKPSLPLPYVIKPPKEGSSVGVNIVREESEIEAAVEDSAKYDVVALVEEFIAGKELTVGVLDGQALPIVEICPRSGFYDMKNKYPWLNDGEQPDDAGSDYYCPAELDEDTTRRVQEAALEAHRALGIEIYSRVDVLLSEDGMPYVLEVNTIPGMTETSLLPKAAEADGIVFRELCERIAELSMAMRQR
jgi:D-alanine-D-alanine ligase